MSATETPVLNPLNVAKDWNDRGFNCEIRTARIGLKRANIHAESDELFMLLDGAVELSVNGQVLQPSLGEEVVIPAGTPHVVHIVGDTDARYLHGCWMDLAQTD